GKAVFCAWMILTSFVVCADPVLQPPPRPPVSNGFKLTWSSGPNEFIYQLVESRLPGMGGQLVEYWPSSPQQIIPPKASGTYFYQVRAWSNLPQQGGVAGPWSNMISLNVLTDNDFLDLIARKTFDYLIATTYPNGLTRDRYAIDGSPTP